ncbi:beta-1,6-N-acetylglucosaminyltransferase [Mucilaginibacter ginkgonis]|uniref:Peptide O-xylosyltransferase n=1 Tax=Mucilaginibacter ginkgonis TaxID=2682091 RepID=A0A6I4I338_9SPHI|nr:beta-1,6-N-acetylglucosaminyltransferase [Mucilaginibacter ginkgonis]QQL49086.1 glycosyl transferase [Mucilaginibacter ginkgonis]
MRLAHLILAHNNPQQLHRLVSRLVCADTDVFIHLDKKADTSVFADINKLPGVQFIAGRVDAGWGNFSIMQATLNGLQEILGMGNTYSHINLLSGADYPLKDPETIKQFLFANADKTFIRYKHIYNDWPETRSRFDLYSFGDYKFPLRFRLQKLVSRILGNRKLPRGLEPYGFSQWFTMTPEAAQYSLDYLRNNKALRRFFRMTWGVDELVFQTILLNSPLKEKIVNDHLRFLKFPSRAFSPDVLTIADKDLMVNSGKFYARKFDPAVDSEILDYLDSLIKV